MRLKKPYNEKCEVININTTPEIEILLIIYSKKYKEYLKCKTNKKPSQFCTEVLKLKNIKKQGFMRDYFSCDIDGLIRTLLEYSSLTQHDDKNLISDLLK